MSQASKPRISLALNPGYSLRPAPGAAAFSPGCHPRAARASDPEVLKFLSARAAARGISLDNLVNELLKKDIKLIEAAE